MADDNVLSKDEIDALLGDMGDDNSKENTSIDEAAQQHEEDLLAMEIDEEQSAKLDYIINGDSSLEAFDFQHQDRVIRGQFPVLERIHERMLRTLADPLYTIFTREIELEQEPLSIVKFGEFVKTLETPLMINIYRFDPLRSKALIIFNNELIFEMVENYYGGHSTGEERPSSDRDLTQAEVNTVNIISKCITKNLEKSWQPIKDIKIEPIQTETSIQLLNVYTRDDLLVVTKFKFSFGNEKSSFYIVMPYLMIDPLKEQLELGGSQSDQEYDPNWINALKNELLGVNLDVSAELSKTSLKLSDVKNWNKGDFIPLEISETISMSIEDFPSFEVKAGVSNDKRSLQIVNKIKH